MTIPVAIVGYAMFGAKDHQMRTGLQRAASTATTAGLVCLMVLWIGDVSQLWLPSLVWSWILLLASAIYFVAASGRGNSLTQVAGYVAGIAGISQV